MNKRIVWIDAARGLAMLVVLLYHTEFYYIGDASILPYNMLGENALALFFFLSGYLFVSSHRPFSLPTKMRNIFRRLIIPYLFFTLLIAIPKAWVHHNPISFQSIIIPIFTGTASWFVSTLIVAEIYYSLIQHFADRYCSSLRSRLLLETCTMLSPVIGYLIFEEYCSIDILSVTTIALVFIFFGRMFRLMEHRMTFIQHNWVIMCMALLLFGMKLYEYRANVSMIFFYIDIDSYTLFYADTLLSCILLITLLSKIKIKLRLLSWTGRHSLVIYFFCGGVPICIAHVMPAYNGCLGLFFVAFLLVWLLASLIAWCVYKLFPWIVGAR